MLALLSCKRTLKGVNILSGLIRYGNFYVPVTFETIRKDVYFCALEDRKETRKVWLKDLPCSVQLLKKVFKNKQLSCKKNIKPLTE